MRRKKKGDCCNVRGDNSEHAVMLILGDLQSEGFIAGYERTSPNGADDSRGVDFWLYLTGGGRMPLQVKSSARNLMVHRLKYPDIPCVVYSIFNELHGSAARKDLLGFIKSHAIDPGRYFQGHPLGTEQEAQRYD